MKINWYPGHMASAKRMLCENLRLIDIAILMLDARIPYSSRNPDLDRLLENKQVLTVLNKADLADPALTKEWVEEFRAKGHEVMAVCGRSVRRADIVLVTTSRAMTTSSRVATSHISRATTSSRAATSSAAVISSVAAISSVAVISSAVDISSVAAISSAVATVSSVADTTVAATDSRADTTVSTLLAMIQMQNIA